MENNLYSKKKINVPELSSRNKRTTTESVQKSMSFAISKGRLAIVLSRIDGFPTAKAKTEQYVTDSEIAAQILTNILGDFADKTVVDLGAGTGILGLGALLCGAKEVILVEQDAEALAVAEQNYASIKSEFSVGKATFVNKDITESSKKTTLQSKIENSRFSSEFCQNADIVVMNPPFGTKQEHADKKFLEKAFAIATTVYSFHKTSTRHFVETVAKDHGFMISHSWDFEFPLKATMKFHERKIRRIEVTAFRFQRLYK